MKKIYLCAAALFFSFNVLLSQQLPLDFSLPSQSLMAFDGSQFSFAIDPENGNNDVGQFFNDGTQNWQGFYIDLAIPIDLSIQQILTLSFYQFDSDAHTIMIKLENGTNPDVEVEVNNSGAGWTYNKQFDFSNAVLSESGAPINAIGSYSRLVIFIDGGVMTPGTYLIDYVNNGSVPGDPNELDVIYNDLVWSDEFDKNDVLGNEIPDTSNWFRQTQLPSGGSWFNGEVQHYTDELSNSYVDDNGFLNIVAIKESYTDQGETKEYTSARLNSKFAFTYGRVDVRAKLPFGDGTWPAIWTLGKNINEDGAYWDNQGFGTTGWPACGEIDIMEHGLHATNEVSSAIHSPSSFGSTINTATQMLSDVANTFHVYSVNWSPNQITFLIDDVGYYTYNPAVKDNNTWPFDEDQYLLLNIAMGGVSGEIDPNFSQGSMVIDYVRVYQNTLSDEDSFTSEFKVYPNPASDIFNISTKEKISSIKLYDLLGQLVLAEEGPVKTVNTSQLNSGMYLLKIDTPDKSITKRLIIN